MSELSFINPLMNHLGFISKPLTDGLGSLFFDNAMLFVKFSSQDGDSSKF